MAEEQVDIDVKDAENNGADKGGSDDKGGGDNDLSDIEARAARMGHVSKDKFRGDLDKWIPAEEFLERGETQIPILRERLRKMDNTVVELKGTISGMKDTFSKFKKYHSETETRAKKWAVREIQKRQRKAVEDGDVESFDAIEKERQELEQEMLDKVDLAESGDDDDGGHRPEAVSVFNTWKEDNEWFDDDPVMQNYAMAKSIEIQQEKGFGGRTLYNAVAKDVKKRFPENFSNKNRDNANAVIGDGESAPANKKQSFANLPKEAMDQCLEFIKDIPGFTKEEYVKNYEWD